MILKMQLKKLSTYVTRHFNMLMSTISKHLTHRFSLHQVIRLVTKIFHSTDYKGRQREMQAKL